MPAIANKQHYESKNHLWCTPPELIANLLHFIGRKEFDLDPCCSKDNVPAKLHYDHLFNGLIQPWEGEVFMNPPYGKSLQKFVTKAHFSSGDKCSVWGLLPCGNRMSGKFYQELVLRSAQFVFFFEGDFCFYLDGKKGGPAPFDVCLAFWGCQEKAESHIARWGYSSNWLYKLQGTLFTRPLQQGGLFNV